jgi:DNA-binding transcriptional ArsR family regulator
MRIELERVAKAPQAVTRGRNMQTDPRQLSLLNHPPPVPGSSRRRDPDTSKEAAKSIDANSLEMRVYQYLIDNGPAILDDLAYGMKLDKVTVSPRLKPLERAGMVVRGRARPGRSGRPQTTWIARPQ